jgi:hypothetical protein
MVRKKLMKNEWFPRPHLGRVTYAHGLETGVANYATMIPIIMSDEGKGDPSAFNANPEHTSFAETSEPNCYPNSRVDSAFVEIIFTMTKGALETDKVHAIRCCFMPITSSFGDELDAKDEKSTETIASLLELQKESTDRQCYPLWNGVDMPVPFTNSTDMMANIPGLTTDQKLEAVAFSVGTFYSALQYYTNGGKLKKCVGGLKWFTLTRQKPFYKVRIHLKGKAKRMNPYTFFGVLTEVPPVDDHLQVALSADTTNIQHVQVNFNYRYNEWNSAFDMEKV